MTKRTLHQWQQLIEQQQNSELSIVAFCKENQLPTSNFYKYRARLQGQKPEPKFIKANPMVKPTAHSDITLAFGQAQLTLPLNCEPRWLASLLNNNNVDIYGHSRDVNAQLLFSCCIAA